MDKKITEKFMEEVRIELGYVSAIFMSQGDIKAKDIIMPTTELEEAADRIGLYFFEALNPPKKDPIDTE